MKKTNKSVFSMYSELKEAIKRRLPNYDDSQLGLHLGRIYHYRLKKNKKKKAKLGIEESKLYDCLMHEVIILEQFIDGPCLFLEFLKKWN